MKRRTFLLGGLLASGVAFAAPTTTTKKKSTSSTKRTTRNGLRAPTQGGPAPIKVPAKLAPELALSGGVWRPYELSIDVSSTSHDGDATLWIPIPMDTPWQQVTAVKWAGGGNAGIRFDPASQLHTYVVEGGSSTPSVTLTLRVETRTRQFDITKRGTFYHESEEDLSRNVRETGYQGTSEGLRKLSEEITGRIIEPLPRARAIYDWLLDKALAGQCHAFEAALPPRTLCPNSKGEDVAIAFVNLCRALNIPARAVWGQIIGESRLSPSLGATGNVTKDQRVRAEFHTPGYGWIPVDPGDVLRVQQRESLTATDPRLQNLRKKLFGYWEMNWVGYMYGPGFSLPGGPDTGLPGLATPLATIGNPRAGRTSDTEVRYRVDAKSLS